MTLIKEALRKTQESDNYKSTHRPSEGEVKLQGDRLGEGECVLAEGVTRYVAEAAGADGRDVGLVLLEAEPEGGCAGRRAWRVLLLLMLLLLLLLLLLLVIAEAAATAAGAAAPAPAAASPVHQRAPVVRQREDLHLEESGAGCRLQTFISLVSLS